LNCSAVSMEAVAAVDDTLHFVVLRTAEGAQLSAVQRSKFKARVGEVQFKVHAVGRPVGAAGPQEEGNTVAEPRKPTASAEKKVARKRSSEMRRTVLGSTLLCGGFF
jgi:hypothetical protein